MKVTILDVSWIILRSDQKPTRFQIKMRWLLQKCRYKTEFQDTRYHSNSIQMKERILLHLPCDLLFAYPLDALSCPQKYILGLMVRRGQLEEVHKATRSQIDTATKKDEDHVRHEIQHKSQEGDKVPSWNPIWHKRLSPKLQSSREGPYTVLKTKWCCGLNPIRSMNSKPRIVHYDWLMLYYIVKYT